MENRELKKSKVRCVLSFEKADCFIEGKILKIAPLERKCRGMLRNGRVSAVFLYLDYFLWRKSEN